VTCQVSKASVRRETLQVRYKGKNIAGRADDGGAEALEFFAAHSPIKTHLADAVDVGMGYIRLGQPATELSAARPSG